MMIKFKGFDRQPILNLYLQASDQIDHEGKTQFIKILNYRVGKTTDVGPNIKLVRVRPYNLSKANKSYYESYDLLTNVITESKYNLSVDQMVEILLSNDEESNLLVANIILNLFKKILDEYRFSTV